MGTLYECLKEAKLDRYYPSFRSHGITKSEALTRLTVNDCPAFGITSAEDKRRLMELISIVKAVHHTERDNILAGPPPGNRSVQNVKNKSPRKRNRSPAQTPLQLAGRSFAATNDIHVRDRSHASASSQYMSGAGAAMLDLISDEETTESSDFETDEPDYEPAVKHSVTASQTRALPGPIRKTPVEKVKHGAGYNYGVPGGGGTGARPKSRGGGRLNLDRIKVCVRKRPLSKRESRAGEEDMVRAASTTTLVVSEPKQAVDLTAYTLQHEFIFDEVFEEKCTNEDVYIRAARPLISCVFDGGSATCFAYGQTGAGKTYTMMGNPEVPGLYLLAAHDIFSIIETGQYGEGIKVWVSFFEIYCGQLFDLLNKRNRLHAREDGSQRVCIAGLTETEATDEQSLMQVLDYGNSVRSKGVSGVNPDSSRSHAVLQMEIRDAADRRLGRISFIDLAGSERAADSGEPDRQTRMEGAEINQSLLALKECIRSIDQESRHKPFRQSKLTHILKDSFMGNSRTCMIANIAPGSLSCEHTLNTLRYADRVKELRRGGGGQTPATGRSSNVAMSNILMNIPAASAPSIFQPTNILCSSTPMRQGSKQFTNRGESRNTAVPDLQLDPSETPIRGPGARRKTATAAARSEYSRNTTSSNSNSASRSASAGAHGESRSSNITSSNSRVSSASVSTGSKTINKVPVTRHIAQAVPNRQNMSSNSESDQTDTDSCNVTGSQRPTLLANQMKHIEAKSFNSKTNNAMKFVSASQNIPLRSSDTDNDFPTTDFNNEDDINEGPPMNDLNRSSGKSAVAASTPVFPSGVSGKVRAAASGSQNTCKSQVLKESDPSESSHQKMSSVSASVPVLRKKIYTDPQQQNQADTDTSPSTSANNQKSETQSNSYGHSYSSDRNNSSSTPLNSATSTKSKDIQRTVKPEVKKPHLLIPSGSTDFEDDLLFDPGSLDQRNWTPRTPSEGAQPKFPQNPSLQPEIPAVLPAKSTELTSFSQSPRWNQHQTYNNKMPAPQYQGFRPEPIRTVPKNSPNSHGKERQNSENNKKYETDAKQMTSPPDKPGKMSQISNKDNANSANSPGSNVPTRGTSEVSRNRNIKDAGKPARNMKEPISGNWFDTPADHDTHLAKSVSGGILNSRGGAKDESKPSVRSASDRDAIRVGADDTSLKKIEGTSAKNVSDRNSSAHSDSGISSVASARTTDIKQGSSRALSKGDKDRANYRNTEFAKPGYFSDTASGVSQNPFTSARSRVVHSPVTTSRQAWSGSPVIKDYVSHSPTLVDDSTRRSDTSSSTESSGSGHTANGALKSEKAEAGACFSPIHPQPVTSGKPVQAAAALSKDIVHPTPVGKQDRQTVDIAGSEPVDLKCQLITSHEDQLATVTSLCKQEMKLLLGAKAGNKSFNDYMSRVSEVLSQKMAAIQLLQDQIMAYQLSTQDSA